MKAGKDIFQRVSSEVENEEAGKMLLLFEKFTNAHQEFERTLK